MPGSLGTPRYSKLMKFLRQARLDAGLSQAELAIRLGKPQSFVAKYEAGERRLDIVEFADIAELTGHKLKEMAEVFSILEDR